MLDLLLDQQRPIIVSPGVKACVLSSTAVSAAVDLTGEIWPKRKFSAARLAPNKAA